MNPRINGKFTKPKSLKKGNECCPCCKTPRHVRFRSRTGDLVCYKCKSIIRGKKK